MIGPDPMIITFLMSSRLGMPSPEFDFAPIDFAPKELRGNTSEARFVQADWLRIDSFVQAAELSCQVESVRFVVYI